MTLSSSQTEREEAIREHARLFDTPRQAVIATTLQGRIVYWSQAAAGLYGWSAEDALGRDILDVTPTSMSRETAAEIMENLRAGRSWSGEFRVRTRDGEEFTARVRDLPVQDARGVLVGIVGVSTRGRT